MAGRATAATSETRRSKAKSDRRSQLIAAAERLIAENGYLAVRLEDIGAATGVTGPAIYRHFPNKEALLTELLVGISTRLLAGATGVVTTTEDPAAALDGLIALHLDFVFTCSVSTAPAMSSPNSSVVFSSNNNSFSMPAKPGRIDRFMKMICLA